MFSESGVIRGLFVNVQRPAYFAERKWAQSKSHGSRHRPVSTEERFKDQVTAKLLSAESR
jgi:hypothetical protein